MPNSLGDMIVRIVGDNSEFDKSINKSETQLQSFDKTINKLVGAMGLGLLSKKIIDIGVSSVKSSAEMEMLQTSFQMMLGSAEKARVLMDQVVKMAAVTPFETPQLANATKMLLQYNVPLKEVLPLMSRLGDIAAGDNARFERLTYAFSQMSALGRVTGQDLRQMVEAGFNPLSVISEKTGESMSSLQDKMSKGKFGIDLMKEALIAATSEGGKFYKGSELGSKTLKGLISTLHDDVGIMERSFSDAYLPTIKKVVDSLGNFALSISKLDNPTKDFIVTMGMFVTAAGPVVLGITLIGKALSATNPHVLAATVGLTAVVAIISLITSKANEAKSETNALAKSIAGTTDVKILEQGIEALNNQIKSKQALARASKLNNEETDKSRKYDKEAQELILKRDNLSHQMYLRLEKDSAAYAETETKGVKVLTDAEKAQQALIDEKEKKRKEYEQSRLVINKQLADGYIQQDEANKQLIAKTQEYIGSLYELGTTSTNSGNLFVTALNEAKNYLDDLIDRSGELSDIERERGEYLEKLASDYIAQQERIAKAEEARSNALTGQYNLYLSQQNKIQLADASKNDAMTKQYTKWFLNQSKGNQTLILEYKKFEDDKNKLIQDGLLKEEDGAKYVRDRKIQYWLEYASSVISIVSSMTSQIKSIMDMSSQNQLDSLKVTTNAQLKANDDALQSALEAAGVADDTKIESAQKQLDAAIKAAEEETDAIKKAALEEKITEAEKALTKAKIEEDYAKKKDVIEKEAAKKAFDIRLAQFKADQAFSLAQVWIDAASAAIKFLVNPGGIAGIGLAAASAVMAGIESSNISKQQPPTLELAEGGIIPSRPGIGTPAILGEGLQPEIVFPLDKLEQFLTRRSMNESYSENSFPMGITIKMDSKVLYSGIFQATKNHDILIDATAVVGG